MTMKALLLENKGATFVVREVPTPAVTPGDVLIKLKASALNHRDYYIQQGTYPRVTYPVIIGSDGAGVVEDVGENVPRSLINTEVVINASQSWGDDPNVQSKGFKVLGFPDSGTFAEYIAVPARYVQPKPKHLSFEEAAAISLAGLTAFRSLFTRGGLESNQNVLVTGIGGGVAIATMQLALAAKANVYVTSGTDGKIKRAIALGAKAGANYKMPTWAEDMQKSSGGFHLVVDGAAGPGFGKLLDIALPGGKIVIYGSTQGRIQNAEPARIFWKQLSVLGATMGTETEFGAMLRFVEQHDIRPVIDGVFPISQAAAGLQRMQMGEQFGKVVFKNDF